MCCKREVVSRTHRPICIGLGTGLGDGGMGGGRGVVLGPFIELQESVPCFGLSGRLHVRIKGASLITDLSVRTVSSSLHFLSRPVFRIIG